jgi:Tfp pilus assembly protein FimT
MILDTQEVFSDAQAVTATAISSNVLDLNPVAGPNAIQDVGNGEPTWLVVSTQTAATDSGSDATLTVTLESDTDPALATTPVVHYSSGALAFATFSPVNTRFVAIRLPSANYQRYLGVRFTVASGPLTAGKFDAFLTHDINATKAYASGFSVQ